MELTGASVADADFLFRLRQESAGAPFLLDTTVAELVQRLEKTASDLRDRRATEFRWMVQRNGVPVGTVVLKNVSWVHGTGEIGYQVTRAHQRQGVGIAAVGAVIARVFRDTDLDRLYATITVGNAPSESLVRRLGFQLEGEMREHRRIHGARVTQRIFGLLRREWRDPAPQPGL